MSRPFSKPKFRFFPCDLSAFGDLRTISDEELTLQLKRAGYPFQKTFQRKPDYIHREIAGVDVLISVGGNIADFNGYIELNGSASLLWDALETPQTWFALRQILEERYKISRSQSTADLQEFLAVLQDRQMVTVQEA